MAFRLPDYAARTSTYGDDINFKSFDYGFLGEMGDDTDHVDDTLNNKIFNATLQSVAFNPCLGSMSKRMLELNEIFPDNYMYSEIAIDLNNIEIIWKEMGNSYEQKGLHSYFTFEKLVHADDSIYEAFIKSLLRLTNSLKTVCEMSLDKSGVLKKEAVYFENNCNELIKRLKVFKERFERDRQLIKNNPEKLQDYYNGTYTGYNKY